VQLVAAAWLYVLLTDCHSHMSVGAFTATFQFHRFFTSQAARSPIDGIIMNTDT